MVNSDYKQDKIMYLNRFSLQVEQGREVDNGYVEMRHGTEYALRLRNDRDADADAVVRIDGIEIGTWRIPAHQNILLERPANIDRKFTFYKFGSAEGVQAGLEPNANLGLISVDFIPAKEVVAYVKSWAARSWADEALSCSKGGDSSRSAGGTGLGSWSSQSFGQAQPIDRDYAQQATINLRLVAVDKPAIVSLRSAVSSPVPPPVL
jgi:hypothetical protein